MNRKTAKKRLHKGKKLEAKKPLSTPATHAATSSSASSTPPTESVSLNYSKVEW